VPVLALKTVLFRKGGCALLGGSAKRSSALSLKSRKMLPMIRGATLAWLLYWYSTQPPPPEAMNVGLTGAVGGSVWGACLSHKRFEG